MCLLTGRQAQRAAPQMIEQMEKWQSSRDKIALENESQIAEYHGIKVQIQNRNLNNIN